MAVVKKRRQGMGTFGEALEGSKGRLVRA